jgi:thiopurine S-methyltransferase
MDKDFWVERWATGQIGFHQGAPHAFLVAHHAHIADARRVYVPLCGKAVDLLWLRAHGHDVVGTEIVPAAIAQLLDDNRLDAVLQTVPSAAGVPFVHHAVAAAAGQGRLDVLQGDAFALDPTVLAGVYGGRPTRASAPGGGADVVHDDGRVDAVYDRAALVALDPPTRQAYVEGLRRLLRPRGRVLLVTFAYDQHRLPGPPWSVDDDTVAALFAAGFTVQRLQVRDEPLGPKFLAAGVQRLTEAAWLLQARA